LNPELKPSSPHHWAGDWAFRQLAVTVQSFGNLEVQGSRRNPPIMGREEGIRDEKLSDEEEAKESKMLMLGMCE